MMVQVCIVSCAGQFHSITNTIEEEAPWRCLSKEWDVYKRQEQICAYLRALLNKQAFDKAGLIYGMGHAVYSLSDPRANIFKSFVEMLSEAKGRKEEFTLYSNVARLAPKIIGEERRIYKGVSANVDFYSGFVYSMLDLSLIHI